MEASEAAKARLFVQAVEKLPQGGRFSFCARGTSMRPVIEDGDTVELERSDVEKAAPGEIVVFFQSSQVLCHRLLKKRFRKGTWYFRSQGDTLWEKDGVFTSRDFLGTVTKVTKPGGEGYSFRSKSARQVQRLFLLLPFFKAILKSTCLSCGVAPDRFYSPGVFRSWLKTGYLWLSRLFLPACSRVFRGG